LPISDDVHHYQLDYYYAQVHLLANHNFHHDFSTNCFRGFPQFDSVADLLSTSICIQVQPWWATKWISHGIHTYPWHDAFPDKVVFLNPGFSA
jgi:hypothetical protein